MITASTVAGLQSAAVLAGAVLLTRSYPWTGGALVLAGAAGAQVSARRRQAQVVGLLWALGRVMREVVR